jgi:hypothetical protein
MKADVAIIRGGIVGMATAAIRERVASRRSRPASIGLQVVSKIRYRVNYPRRSRRRSGKRRA